MKTPEDLSRRLESPPSLQLAPGRHYITGGFYIYAQIENNTVTFIGYINVEKRKLITIGREDTELWFWTQTSYGIKDHLKLIDNLVFEFKPIYNDTDHTIKICLYCGQNFEVKNRHQENTKLYCNERCSRRAFDKRKNSIKQ